MGSSLLLIWVDVSGCICHVNGTAHKFRSVVRTLKWNWWNVWHLHRGSHCCGAKQQEKKNNQIICIQFEWGLAIQIQKYLEHILGVVTHRIHVEYVNRSRLAYIVSKPKSLCPKRGRRAIRLHFPLWFTSHSFEKPPEQYVSPIIFIIIGYAIAHCSHQRRRRRKIHVIGTSPKRVCTIAHTIAGESRLISGINNTFNNNKSKREIALDLAHAAINNAALNM